MACEQATERDGRIVIQLVRDLDEMGKNTIKKRLINVSTTGCSHEVSVLRLQQ
jgi:hypothetical protein